MVWLGAVLYWVVATCASLVAAPRYEVSVVLALATAALFFRCAYLLRNHTKLSGKIMLIVLAAPLVVLTLDNLGRALHLLGGPLIRLL